MVLLPESENDIVKIVKICYGIIPLLLQEGPVPVYLVELCQPTGQ